LPGPVSALAAGDAASRAGRVARDRRATGGLRGAGGTLGEAHPARAAGGVRSRLARHADVHGPGGLGQAPTGRVDATGWRSQRPSDEAAHALDADHADAARAYIVASAIARSVSRGLGPRATRKQRPGGLRGVHSPRGVVPSTNWQPSQSGTVAGGRRTGRAGRGRAGDQRRLSRVANARRRASADDPTSHPPAGAPDGGAGGTLDPPAISAAARGRGREASRELVPAPVAAVWGHVPGTDRERVVSAALGRTRPRLPAVGSPRRDSLRAFRCGRRGRAI